MESIYVDKTICCTLHTYESDAKVYLVYNQKVTSILRLGYQHGVLQRFILLSQVIDPASAMCYREANEEKL
jgi:hypothetical protein